MDTDRQQRPTARDRILAAADQLFYSDGIAATGIDAIVERAGVALGSLYNNFGGKDGLVEAYLRRRDHLWRATWESAVADAISPTDRVLAIFDALLAWCRERGGLQGCAQVAGLMQLPVEHPGATVARAHREHLLRRLTELAAEAGLPADDVANDVLLAYDGALTGLLITASPEVVIPRACRFASLTIDRATSSKF